MERGYTKRIDGYDAMGRPAYAHLAGPDDTSEIYPGHTGYDPACGLCWLGATHTYAAHDQRTK